MGVLVKLRTSIGHDVSPRSHVRWQPDAEERERSLDEDRRRTDVGRLNDQGSYRVGKNVLGDDLPRWRVQSDSGLYKRLFTNTQNG